jgi:large subunit ribosomal protein L29
MKASDLREKSGEDLRELAKTLARDVFQNRLKNFTNRLDDTSAIRKAKRDYARVVTVLGQQQAPVAASAKVEDQAPKAEAKAPVAKSDAKPKKTATKKASAKAGKAGDNKKAEAK